MGQANRMKCKPETKGAMSFTMKTKIGHRDEPVFLNKAISTSSGVKYLEVILDTKKLNRKDLIYERTNKAHRYWY